MRFPYRISIVRLAARLPSATPARRNYGFRVPAAIVAAIAASALSGGPIAFAGTSGSTTAIVTVATRSITVSPGSTSFNGCTISGSSTGSVLGFPNGTCFTGTSNAITITNGPLPGHIDVTGSDAVPSDGGTHWTLCAFSACTGSGTSLQLPGQDQFSEYAVAATTGGPYLTTSAQCDGAFAAGTCAAQANQATTEQLTLVGPSYSTDTSQNFSTIWSWTALP